MRRRFATPDMTGLDQCFSIGGFRLPFFFKITLAKKMEKVRNTMDNSMTILPRPNHPRIQKTSNKDHITKNANNTNTL